ncbi:MAG: transposase, partial [Pseudomonadota bacterium]
MPRRRRIHVPGGFYHVILRGNNRAPIFRQTEDRASWEALLSSGLKQYECSLHSYCWMTNHVHLAIQINEVPLGRLIRWLCTQYARWFNKKYERTGHLFERRHRAMYVLSEEYMTTLVRYIHRNPLEGKLVRDPIDYEWSSHRDYICGSRHTWLTTD